MTDYRDTSCALTEAELCAIIPDSDNDVPEWDFEDTDSYDTDTN